MSQALNDGKYSVELCELLSHAATASWFVQGLKLHRKLEYDDAERLEDGDAARPGADRGNEERVAFDRSRRSAVALQSWWPACGAPRRHLAEGTWSSPR